MKKYLQYWLLAMWLLMIPMGESVSAAAVDKIPSGIQNNTIHYELKWCPAHVSLAKFATWNGCYYGKFERDGAQWAKLPVKWITSATLIDTFQNGETSFLFQAEWTIDVKVWAQDNAENITVQSLAYLIDKTPPQLWNIGFSENSPYLSVEDRPNKAYKAKIKWALAKYFGFNEFPSLDDYIDIPKDNHREITDMKTIRYKVSNVPRNDTLTITFQNLSDSWEKLSRSHVSGLQKVELLLDNKLLTTFRNIKEWENKFTIKPRELFELQENHGRYWVFRAYDSAGNTSDHVFYAFRDETVPVVKAWDGKFQIDFRFDWSEYNIASQGAGLSHFALATNNAKINYSWGELNTHMADIIMRVEKDKDPSDFNAYNLNADNTQSHLSNKIELTDVDTDLYNQSAWKNFREYSVEFETPGISGNSICDSVWNCIDGTKVLSKIRTIAWDISKEQSYLQVKTPQKAIADNKNFYEFNLTLEDKYGNKIREVKNGTEQIKTNLYTFNFENNLLQELADYTKLGATQVSNPITLMSWEAHQDNKVNEENSFVAFKEASNASDGSIDFKIASFIPTHWAYPFLKDDVTFAISKTTWSLTYNPTITFDFDTSSVKNQSSYQLAYGNNKTIDISWDIQENPSKKYEMFIPYDYGAITNNFWNESSNNYKSAFFKDIENTKKLQLEFASPVIYHAQNFNILRDGIDSNHYKKFEKYWNVTSIKYRDKYFDINNQENTSDRVKFSVDNGTRNDLSSAQNFKTGEYTVKYEAVNGQDFSEWGYVSYIQYYVWSKQVLLPSISRSIKPSNWNRLQASAYFPTSISQDTEAGTSFLTNDVAIDGLVNNVDGWATSDVADQSWLVALDLKRPYTRAGLLENVKKKIFEINRQDMWCAPGVMNVNYENDRCTFTVEWETITFIKGNVKITGGILDEKRSIIVTDGSIEITWNISRKDTNGQLFLASVSNKWLTNIYSLINRDITDDQLKGWIAIEQNVTNVDAFILAQWSLVSTNNAKIITNYDNETQLLNQLHIYGSVFSLNTIGWSKTWDCPYIYEGTCEIWSDVSKVFDLSFLRRFTLVDGNNYGATWEVIPYNPEDGDVRTSGWCTHFQWGLRDVWASTAKWCDSDLRTPEKDTHWFAPVIIQRDQKWSSNPTYFSKGD